MARFSPLETASVGLVSIRSWRTHGGLRSSRLTYTRGYLPGLTSILTKSLSSTRHGQKKFLRCFFRFLDIENISTVPFLLLSPLLPFSIDENIIYGVIDRIILGHGIARIVVTQYTDILLFLTVQ